MSKRLSTDLCTKQVKCMWDKALDDIDLKLKAARERVAELESAKKVFRRRKAEGAPWPEPATQN